MNRRIKLPGVAAVTGVTLLVLGGGSLVAVQEATPAAEAPTPTPFSLDELSAIQRGLGTVMMEYGHRMAAVWFAGEAGNWDMAHYQIIEMGEIQETGETTRPARAPALKSFESSFLDPLDQAVQANDRQSFSLSFQR
jgi:hypothetical protein